MLLASKQAGWLVCLLASWPPATSGRQANDMLTCARVCVCARAPSICSLKRDEPDCLSGGGSSGLPARSAPLNWPEGCNKRCERASVRHFAEWPRSQRCMFLPLQPLARRRLATTMMVMMMMVASAAAV